MASISELSITSISIDNLHFLKLLKNLRRLYIGFGTSRNLFNIKELKRLEELHILYVKQLSDISSISKLTNLLELKIGYVKQIDSLPDLSQLKRLKSIQLEKLNGIKDLTNLKESCVEELRIINCGKTTDILFGLNEINTLKRIHASFETKREQQNAEIILGDKHFQFENMLNGLNYSFSRQKYFDIGNGEIY